MSENEDEKTGKAENPSEEAAAPEPILRGLTVKTDGTLITVSDQTCSNLELTMIGQTLLGIARGRDQAAMAATRQQNQPPPPKVEEPDEKKPDEPGK